MTKQITEIFRKTTTRVKGIAFHPTNPIMITANHCGTVYIWNIFYQEIIAVLREHSGSVRCVKIHPSGEIFATAGDDKIIRIWNYKTRKIVQTMKGHSDYIRSIDFHPTKPWIVSGSDDCTIKVWNIYTGEQLSSSTGHTHYVMSVLFLDNNHILTGSLDHTMALWDCSNLFEKKKFMVPDVILVQTIEAHSRGVNCMSRHDDYVVSGSDDREIKVWRFTNETLILEKNIYSHDGNVTSVFNDEESVYGGGEDNVFSAYTKGKSSKNIQESRIWSIGGRDDYLAIGTDDGIVFYRKSINLTSCISGNNIYYSVDDKILKYNMKQSIDYCSIKKPLKLMFFREDYLYLIYDKKYEVFEDDRKIEGDLGSVAFVGNDKYSLKDNQITKNGSIFRTEIQGILHSIGDLLFVIDNKSLTVISGEKEYSSTYNFIIKSVSADEKRIAVIGNNKILILDYTLNIIHTINELVEVNSGIFYDGVFIYSTLKQLRFFYEDTGILQSIDTYIVPVFAADDYLYVLSQKGIEKILLNMSEIRFRKAVLDDDNILSVIEEEQLPGLSPLEYLMKKNKGGIALPFINDDEKRFQLFLNDCNYDEALKLCSNTKMYNELGFHSLKNGRYDISEICFRRNHDEINLFYLLLCTKQFEKMKDLQNEEVENMMKIILEDKTIFKSIIDQDNIKTESEHKIPDNHVKNISEKISKVSISDKKTCLNDDSDKKRDNDIKISDKEHKDNNTINEEYKINRISDSSDQVEGYSNSSDQIEEHSNSSDQIEEHSNSSDQIEEHSNSSDQIEEHSDRNSLKSENMQINSESESCIKTDQATLNDSDLQSQIFDLSEIDLDNEIRNTSMDELYENALELTTQGKFSKAIEIFRDCISLIALKLSNSSDYIDRRRRIGNYLLGLHLEKNRKNVEDPEKNIKMSLFFADLDLDDMHLLLVKNLAITTCFKHGNLKTAYEIAQKYPDCKNSKRVLSEECKEDLYEIEHDYICYDTLEHCENPKICAMCFVKSENGEICQACKIGILH